MNVGGRITIETKNLMKYKLFIFAATLLWGSSFFVHKITMDVFNPISLVALRNTTAFVVLGCFQWKKLKGLDRSYLKAALLMGAIVYSGFVISSYGLIGTEPGVNAFLTAVYCIIVPFFAWIISKNRPHGAQFGAAIICIIGIGFVSLKPDFTIGIGDALSLVSGVIFAVQIVLISHYTQKKDPVVLTLLIFGVTAVLAWATVGVGGVSILNDGVRLTADAMFGLFYLSIPTTLVAFLLQNTAQKHVNPSAASLILSLEAVFAVIFSMIFYGEQLTVQLVCGFALIFFAIVISETRLSFFTDRVPKWRTKSLENPAASRVVYQEINGFSDQVPGQEISLKKHLDK